MVGFLPAKNQGKERVMNEPGVRVANRAGPQAQDFTRGNSELLAPHRSRWPFTVTRQQTKEPKAAPKDESSGAAKSQASFCFTT
jgi:hypothetical protein